MTFLCADVYSDFVDIFGADLVILAIAIFAVSVALIVVSFAALIARIRVLYLYWFANRHKSSGGYTGESAARAALDRLGFTDVQVRKSGIIRALIFGNYYNRFSKIIWLRRSTMYGDNLTSVGLAIQKVGMVMQDKRGEKTFRVRSNLQMIGVFGPIVFLPLIIIGLIIDAFNGFTGIPTLVCAALAVVYFICSFILTLLNIPVEKKANKEALEFLQSTDTLNEDEIREVEKVFRGYLIAYVLDFIINLLKLIQAILKIVLNITIAKRFNK